ncbi:hypothetical protein [aff. Roholtiella sp. LEGE 12411]|uniref:hypothetical protein n=1 Tax=aff. Roholtiella sp. LEGE 12411 TaxID=1828822 RepID=UPI00188153A0|nr:hypothetical protein [aff. Roholtiella sp. LEGE 12411]MBE9038298.1 hypothetical protein [aff. Roholtiella sp. LEGE 12411]
MAQKIPFLFLASVFSAPLRLDKLLGTAQTQRKVGAPEISDLNFSRHRALRKNNLILRITLKGLSSNKAEIYK